MTSIQQKVARSSFGTRQAQAARRTVSAETASRIVARAAVVMSAAKSKKVGG